MTDPAGAVATPPPTGPYRWFAAGVASWFGFWGMQQVLFSWLVVGELHASAESVGLAQTASMLPALVLLLVGGATAERFDTQRLLTRLHLLAAIPVLVLCAVVAAGRLRFPHILAYAIAMGSVQAFIMPARDTLLSRVAGADLMRAVVGLTAAQFGAQATGALLAGGARVAGSAAMIGVQGAILLAGAFATSRIPPAPPHPRAGARAHALRELTAGIPVVARTPELRWPLALVTAVGMLFVGPYMVIFPLLVRDAYRGDALDLALVTMQFPLGTIAGSLFIRSRGGIRRKGRASLWALAWGSMHLTLVGLGLPFWGTMVATFAWGLGGSVFINCSRTLFQQAAPAAERARVLAVYQLGFIGGAPIGTSVMGVASAALGLHGSLLLASSMMFCVVAALALFTRTPQME